MRREIPLLLAAIVLASGCVAPMYGPHAYRYASRQAPSPEPPPVGRWDNVMMLAAGTPVHVLTMDAGLTAGRMIRATGSVLHLETSSAEMRIDAADVIRVDRLPTMNGVRAGLRGAATGAGFVGVLGLLAGEAPPARTFAAGAITGAYTDVQLHRASPGRVTIYLSDRTIEPQPAGTSRPLRK